MFQYLMLASSTSFIDVIYVQKNNKWPIIDPCRTQLSYISNSNFFIFFITTETTIIMFYQLELLMHDELSDFL